MVDVRSGVANSFSINLKMDVSFLYHERPLPPLQPGYLHALVCILNQRPKNPEKYANFRKEKKGKWNRIPKAASNQPPQLCPVPYPSLVIPRFELYLLSPVPLMPIGTLVLLCTVRTRPDGVRLGCCGLCGASAGSDP